MSNNINAGGPAFPDPQEDWRGEKGMTLRDYFAAKAIMEFISAQDIMQPHFKQEAEAAYRVADSMLAAKATGGEL